ncbi:MAG TPA: hypothetical protein VGM87_25335 [Roseomonas sp.]|jgi:cation transport regulator ChaB
MAVTVETLVALLPQAWSRDSSSQWQLKNPAAGQCGVTALLVQDLLGGEILKTRLGSAWHFYNRLDGRRHDLTESQFAAPIAYDDVATDWTDAMTDTSPRQYAALRARALALLAERAA